MPRSLSHPLSAGAGLAGAAALLMAACTDAPDITSSRAAAPPSSTIAVAPVSPGAATVPSVPGRMRWRVRLDGDYSLHSAGVGADGTVYVPLSNGKLTAVSPSGVVAWGRVSSTWTR